MPAGWTPDQIKQFQDYWDTEFSGDLARRRKAKFVPGDTAAHVVQTKEPEHKDDAEEFASPDLELHWLDEDDGAAQAEAHLEARVKLSALTLNGMRDALGLDPFATPADEAAWTRGAKPAGDDAPASIGK